jgi:hypothetical protein
LYVRVGPARTTFVATANTEIARLSDFPPLDARSHAMPALIPVTAPLAVTAAIAESELANAKCASLIAAPAPSRATAASCTMLPTSIELSLALSAMLAIGPGVGPVPSLDDEQPMTPIAQKIRTDRPRRTRMRLPESRMAGETLAASPHL